MREFIDKNGSTAGTPLNREHMMAIQGFDGGDTSFSNGGLTITEKNSKNHTLTTTISESNGITTITEVFQGDLKLTKTTTIKADGSITEVIS